MVNNQAHRKAPLSKRVSTSSREDSGAENSIRKPAQIKIILQQVRKMQTPLQNIYCFS